MNPQGNNLKHPLGNKMPPHPLGAKMPPHPMDGGSGIPALTKKVAGGTPVPTAALAKGVPGSKTPGC